jgi:hypothetical protein
MWWDLLGDTTVDVSAVRQVLEEVLMGIVGALDLHRKHVTFDWVDTESDGNRRGRLSPANRESSRRWLAKFEDRPVKLVVEGCAGWRFIAEEAQVAGAIIHVADPAEAATLGRGKKRRAKTDKVDARALRELLECAPSRATCSGHSPTTSPRCRWPRWACSTRSSPGPRWRLARSSW